MLRIELDEQPKVESGLMKCPFCLHDIPQMWQKLYTHTNAIGETANAKETLVVDLPEDRRLMMWLRWMRCPNDGCGQILVQAETDTRYTGNNNPQAQDILRDKRLVVPQTSAARTLHPTVPDPFRQDYLEASLILENSPRMSAVLSRRIVGDLLEKYADRTEYNLAKRIDKFIEDKSYPSHVRDNLHHLREIADFGAHTQTDQADGTIIDVDRDEAEWTLDIVDSLFDYFIVGPETDRLRREAFDKKMEAAGRKPIKKP
jgi:uncharacterized protein DUF4145